MFSIHIVENVHRLSWVGLALDWVLHKARSGRRGFKESCSLARSYRPIGGCREACWAWPGFEPTRRAKLVARAASGRAGLAVAGDLAGLWQAGDLAGQLVLHGIMQGEWHHRCE